MPEPAIPVLLVSWVLGGVATSGCLVDSKCQSDADCPQPEICREERCVFECARDGDCLEDFGIEFVCERNHCRFPAACLDCAFDHAGASCVHGDCRMGECEEGFHDINRSAADGCEVPCSPTAGGVEICDQQDNDCDGETDEGFDLEGDIAHCGECENACPVPPHADPKCVSGRCLYVCHPGWFENDRQAEDGCEASACVAGEEVCDGFDNDCDCPGDTNADGEGCGPGDEGVDEGFDKTLPATCGPYCIACAFDHAAALCVEGTCRLGACEADWFDADRKPANGCECAKTNGGEEICDEVDNDCDGEVDEGVCVLRCPEGMVPVENRFCIDVYEASRPDANAESQGSATDVAYSRAGVRPWMVNPMTYDHLLTFQAACQAAGKHLCTPEEWFGACTGPAPGTVYVFGDTFDRETCNCVDAFCDDHCAQNGIPPEQCSTDANCGYTYSCFHVVATRSFPNCTGAVGTFDQNGNVWEVVPSASDPRGYEVRGGAFNCASAAARLQCTYNAGWNELYTGFRCCLAP